MNETAPQQTSIDLERVLTLLGTISQGDVISLGAVNIVGVGPSAAWSSTAEHEGLTDREPGEEVWSLSIESDVGWYAVITQDCDIVRAPHVEPCLVVCPVKYVSAGEWQALASGPRSPRYFPLPDGKFPGIDGKLPVADLRFLTSVDKTALLHPSVKILHPLSAPQRASFGRCIGSRYARVPHPDKLEKEVLPKAATLIRKLAKSFAAGNTNEPEVRLVGAARGWYLGGNDKRVVYVPMISEASARVAGLWDNKAGAFDEQTIKAATERLARKLRASLPPNAGYTCSVEPRTLHSTSAADLLEWSEWIVEEIVDAI
ncbi:MULTISPECIES: hypothetical protein [Paenarthrobacter]|uniref:Uncharacterized protein n=1 Tax=Paenarthrobacter ureafaciens TaxID=37931 RepID=A0AAX3EJ13_PAEUR|nr:MULTISPECIES: hypothetical protein [Paenarthrobacter]MDO5862940.1 hypothetical protein [Paenarthrobacter sp. SD-2]MDO5874009.1 hypothetical protein [Paenarthrobacter sp. SD-1]QMU81014.1 hypothetical protein FV140_01635 [Paenarthrobacter ureafaciens]UYV93446.1 hypothetical protein NL395_01670 [Paenarthrobacter ureafaciens]UYV97975.1 hypothetical protein NL394_01630 [Paenarthrobacter ureafaciens]